MGMKNLPQDESRKSAYPSVYWKLHGTRVNFTGLRNTSIIFFPPNCTSKLQPADREIIQNLKVRHRLVAILGEEKPVKAIDLKDVVFMIAKAWDNVSQNTIKGC